MSVKLRDLDNEITAVRSELENGNVVKALQILNDFQDDWNYLKESLDSFWSDIKRD